MVAILFCVNESCLFVYSYLNTQVIKKQKHTDAELCYGYGVEIEEKMLEIGEVGNNHFNSETPSGISKPDHHYWFR